MCAGLRQPLVCVEEPYSRFKHWCSSPSKWLNTLQTASKSFDMFGMHRDLCSYTGNNTFVQASASLGPTIGHIKRGQSSLQAKQPWCCSASSSCILPLEPSSEQDVMVIMLSNFKKTLSMVPWLDFNGLFGPAIISLHLSAPVILHTLSCIGIEQRNKIPM